MTIPHLPAPWTTWGIAAAATAGVILRPFAAPEWIWATLGAGLLVALRLLPPTEALAAVARGTDVYLFLTGMTLLSELARREGLFDWLAAHAARRARGSAPKLFTLIYATGTLVTVFLSNDATAVVLTPAVAAAVRAARAEQPLPHLFICALVANAASFVLPISNPANLVLYGNHVPPLAQWLPRYALPSALAILVTYGLLRWTQRAALRARIAADIDAPNLSAAGKRAAIGIALTALVLLAASAADIPLGLPTFAAGVATALLVLTRSRQGVLGIAMGASWGVLPLVAGLFVMVGALEHTGVTAALATVLGDLIQRSGIRAAWATGLALGVGANLVNNLPAGLVAGRVADLAHASEPIRAAALIGIDLGPNLSVTGSLATILWLTALRREGHRVGALVFLKLGALVMPPALVLALAAALAAT